MRRTLVVASTVCALIAASAPPVLAQERTSSAFTLSSGTPRTPEQGATRLHQVDLTLEIDPAERSIAGRALLFIRPTEPLSAVVVELDTVFDISRITVNGTPIENWTNPEGRLTIPLPAPAMAESRLLVAIEYAGKPHTARNAPWDGGFVWSESNGQPWIATAVQGEGCDLIWPCIDHPMGKPERMILHLKVPDGLVAVTNGSRTGQRSDGTHTTTHWIVSHPNTYAISLNIGPYREMAGTYDSRFGNRIRTRFWPLQSTPEHKAQRLFDELPLMLDFFEAWVGPYPFAGEKVGVVETPHLGMEHQTINAYGNGYKLDGKGYDWLMQHELAHEWFGNQMTNASWDDMWLHEGFGTYMQPLYARWLNSERAMQSELETMRRTVSNRFPMVTGREQDAATVYNAQTGPGLDLYYKGALIAHTLRLHIGDEAFKQSLRELVYDRPDPAPGNFTPVYRTTADYVAIVNRITGQDMGWFFDAYLYHAALPELVMERQGDQVTLTWKTGSQQPFTMPLDIEIDGRLQTLPMQDGTARFTADPRAHILLDPQSKVLRHLPHIEQWKSEEQGKAETRS